MDGQIISALTIQLIWGLLPTSQATTCLIGQVIGNYGMIRWAMGFKESVCECTGIEMGGGISIVDFNTASEHFWFHEDMLSLTAPDSEQVWRAGCEDAGPAAPTEAAPTKAAPGEAAPTEAAPGENAPTEAAPGEDVPTKAAPGENAPTEAAPGEGVPTEAAPGEAAPTKAVPGENVPTKAAPGEEAPTEADPGEDNPTKAAPGEVAPTEAAPDEVVPFKAAPNEAAATEAVLTEAVPTTDYPSDEYWKLVYRAVAGVSDPDPYAIWTSGIRSESFPRVQTHLVNGTGAHYLNGTVDKWHGVKEIKLGLYDENEAELLALVFNGTGSTKMNWMSKERLTSSPFTDFAKTSIEYFSIDGYTNGETITRRFYIQHTAVGGCDSTDLGWLMMRTGESNCEELFADSKTPVFLYSKTSGVAAWANPQDVGSAASLKIFIKKDPNVAPDNGHSGNANPTTKRSSRRGEEEADD